MAHQTREVARQAKILAGRPTRPGDRFITADR